MIAGHVLSRPWHVESCNADGLEALHVEFCRYESRSACHDQHRCKLNPSHGRATPSFSTLQRVARVAVLNGGFPAWQALGHEVDTVPQLEVTASAAAPAAALASTTASPQYPAQLKAALVKGLADVQHLVQSGEAQIVDARPAGRFAGTSPEPRASIRSGHMPGA